MKNVAIISYPVSSLFIRRVTLGIVPSKAGSVILPGITIGENAFIAAGSVVTKDVPAGELWMGNPARFYREVDF